MNIKLKIYALIKYSFHVKESVFLVHVTLINNEYRYVQDSLVHDKAKKARYHSGLNMKAESIVVASLRKKTRSRCIRE